MPLPSASGPSVFWYWIASPYGFYCCLFCLGQCYSVPEWPGFLLSEQAKTRRWWCMRLHGFLGAGVGGLGPAEELFKGITNSTASGQTFLLLSPQVNTQQFHLFLPRAFYDVTEAFRRA
jgi:hypothetical protein